VWQLRCSTTQTVRAHWQAWLSPDEQERLHQYRRAADRDRFLCSRGGLRYLLASYLQQPPARLQLQYGAQGRPALASASVPLQFNVAHSGDWVLWAFSRCQWIGVDVEVLQPRQRLRSLIQKCLTPEEQAAVAREPTTQLAQFLSVWTVKEAHLKAVGLGLSYPLQQVQVALQPAPTLVRPAQVAIHGATAWYVHVWQPDPAAIAALCVGQSPCRVELLDLTANDDGQFSTSIGLTEAVMADKVESVMARSRVLSGHRLRQSRPSKQDMGSKVAGDNGQTSTA
jgi:4'-phosphopantetheinyl transferase